MDPHQSQGVEVWNAFVQVKPNAQYVGIILPVREIEPGEYVIELQNPESKIPAAAYVIQVQ